jgi:hypothetical protein
MRRTSGFAVLVAVFLGCGPGKELPDPSMKGQTKPQPEPVTPVPAKSEDKARAIVEAALKATSGGDVTRIEKVKAFRSSATGVMQRPVAGQLLNLETTREFEAAWPNSFRLRVDSQSLKPFTIGLRRPVVWLREGDESRPFPDPRHAEEIAAIDAVGLNWLCLLVPLPDSKVVVFAHATTTFGEKAFDVVKASVAGFPVFTLTFNDAHLLSRVEYSNLEQGSQTTKLMNLTDHKPFGGLMLPAKVEVVRNGTVIEQWNMTKWEVVEKMDESIFDMPK